MGATHGGLAVSEINKEKIITSAVAEYRLNHSCETDGERMGRRAAVRGLMVRLGLYDRFLAALGEDE